MHALPFLLALYAAFWEVKAPQEWTQQELQKLFEDSPWAQVVTSGGGLPVPSIQMYVATAPPMRLAEAEFARRHKIIADVLKLEYETFLRENPGKYIVLAVYMPDQSPMAAAGEARTMEEESRMRAGRKSLKITGHFPPSSTDPYLRLVFPRVDLSKEKNLVFEIYVPGVPNPYRTAEFRVRDMRFQGEAAY
jgi:hypothetical protein